MPTLACPHCPRSPLEERGGSALHDSPCSRCGGTFLSSSGVARVVHEEHGIDVATLRELIGQHGGTQLECPSCAYAMSHVQVKGVALELCTGCGGAWLDDGELHRLSQGRYGAEARPRPALQQEAALQPVGTAAEQEPPGEPVAPKTRRFGCGTLVGVTYAGAFGVGMTVVGVSVGSWQLGLIGLGGLAVAGLVLFAPTERPAPRELGPDAVRRLKRRRNRS